MKTHPIYGSFMQPKEVEPQTLMDVYLFVMKEYSMQNNTYWSRDIMTAVPIYQAHLKKLKMELEGLTYFRHSDNKSCLILNITITCPHHT